MLELVTIAPHGSAVDRAFGTLIERAQAMVVQLVDRHRQPRRAPPTASLIAKLEQLGIRPDLLKWGPMTLLPYRAEYLLDEVQRRPPRSVLEIGAGASTLLFAALSARYGFTLVSVENFAGSVEYVRRLLRESSIDSRVVVQKCGFKRGRFPDGSGYWWYDAELGLSAANYDFVFVDGPMSTLVGREGMLPEVLPFLAPGARVYVDDTHHRHGRRCLATWTRNYPALVVTEGCEGISKLSIPGHP